MTRLTKMAGALALGLAAAGTAMADDAVGPLVVTASNATSGNALLVYDTSGKLLHTISTQGNGGASGNAGGVTYAHGRLAVVNYGSSTVSVFKREGEHGELRLTDIVPTSSAPLSVAFSADHLYILGSTTVESHAIEWRGIDARADGVAALVVGDGSAAQVGVLTGRLVISEKSNTIESVALDAQGAITGPATAASNPPAAYNAPFGLATRGNDAYVTIAHSNEVSLVRNNSVLTVVGSGTQVAPCWAALDGPFLYTANAGSKTVSRFAVYGQKIVQDAAVVATTVGGTVDIAALGGRVAVIDHSGTVSHVSSYKVDEDGNFTLTGTASVASGVINGVAVVPQEFDRY